MRSCPQRAQQRAWRGAKQRLLILLESEGSQSYGHVSSCTFDFAGLPTRAFFGPLTARSLREHTRLEFKLMAEGPFAN